jgi:ectoine hydroxylase-related dioxygenase (phytanoyl-CoA dioxygenase family)
MDVDATLATLRQQGWVVLERVLAPATLDAMRAALAPHLRRELLGRNDFEGFETERVYTLVDRGPLFADLVEHPTILALCDALLAPGYQLTASQAIRIHPGETPQPFHTDDTFYPIPRPRPAISISTIWAIDDFTAENGATQIVEGSHRWDDAEVGRLLADVEFATRPRADRTPVPKGEIPAHWRDRVRDVVMPAGSVIVFLGTLVHRGGGNRSAAPRLALSNQYCEPWARPQENWFLAVPRERAATLPPRVQALLGYAIHPPFMGHAGGLHPRRWLAPADEG